MRIGLFLLLLLMHLTGCSREHPNEGEISGKSKTTCNIQETAAKFYKDLGAKILLKNDFSIMYSYPIPPEAKEIQEINFQLLLPLKVYLSDARTLILGVVNNFLNEFKNCRDLAVFLPKNFGWKNISFGISFMHKSDRIEAEPWYISHVRFVDGNYLVYSMVNAQTSKPEEIYRETLTEAIDVFPIHADNAMGYFASFGIK